VLLRCPTSWKKTRQRQEHIGYFVICLFLFLLAEVLGLRAGWLAVLALWAALIAILEIIYRWVISLGVRNRKTWWGQPRPVGYWRLWRPGVYASIILAGALIRSPFTRHAVLVLLGAGLLCAGIIRLLHNKDQV